MPFWLIVVISCAVSAAGAAGVTAKIYKGEIAGIYLAQEKAVNKAIVKAQADQRDADAVVIDLTASEESGQIKIVDHYHTIEKEIPIYVQDDSRCITYGLIRVLDAAAIGADPKDLVLAAGEYNESCAPVKATDLANNVAGNYGIAHQNAEQLTTLQAWASDVQRRSSAP